MRELLNKAHVRLRLVLAIDSGSRLLMEIARRSGAGKDVTRVTLSRLERNGLVRRAGDEWLLTAKGTRELRFLREAVQK